MSRIRCLSLLQDDSKIREEIAAAIESTRSTLALPSELDRGVSASAAFGSRNYSLCHGMGGNAELMLMASQEFATDQREKRELYDVAAGVGAAGIEYFEKLGRAWPCGTQKCLETPSLMTGTAGIGHFYLRLHDPATVPAILILKPDSDRRATVLDFNARGLS